MSQIEQIALKRIDGAPATLGDWSGQVRLVVNVASACGFTPQYAGLEELYKHYKDRGFAVLGFPANDFGAQEPGSNSQIAMFCTMNFGVDFPMFEKLVATGPSKHPLYAELTAARPAQEDGEAFRAKLRGWNMTPNPEPELLWNFEKFVIGRDGQVAARFSSDTAPNDPALIEVIEAELAK